MNLYKLECTKTKMIPLSSFFLFLCIAFFIHGCDRTPSLTTVSVQGRTMGTTYSVKLVGSKSGLPSNTDLQKWADDTFANINQSMSTYIPDSELSLLNTSTASDWQSVSDDLYFVLSLSQKISQLSHGAFDITVAPLVNLWGFGPKAQQEQIPTQEAISAVRESIGFSKLKLSLTESSIQKPVGLTMDLSAVAKGFAADALAKQLASKGYRNVMVEVGGELFLDGVNDRGKVWTIGIETPSYDPLNTTKTPVRGVSISGMGMATSGDYRNYYEENGVRYSHTIDPLTGRPITHNLASVTVIADSCAEADALATALNVMGSEKALVFAEQNALAVYLIVRSGDQFEVKYSSAFHPYLAVH